MTEQEKIAELMKPRFKLIADYKHCPWPIGTILKVAEDGELYSAECGYAPTRDIVSQDEANTWPHLFKPLKWY